MFFSAPQAEWCTSLLGWSSRETKDGIPFRRRTSDLTWIQIHKNYQAHIEARIEKDKHVEFCYCAFDFVWPMFHLIVFECEMLEEGGSVGLDRVQTVVQHGDDLRQLRLSPWTGRTLPQRAVQWSHAPPLHRHGNTPGVRINTSHVTVQSIFTAPAHDRGRTLFHMRSDFRKDKTGMIWWGRLCFLPESPSVHTAGARP